MIPIPFLLFSYIFFVHREYVSIYQWRRQVFKSGGMIYDFKKNTEILMRKKARERSDQARGSEATERGEDVGGGGGVSPSHGREIFQFYVYNFGGTGVFSKICLRFW